MFDLGLAGKFDIDQNLSKHSTSPWGAVLKNNALIFDFAAWPFTPIAQLIKCVSGCISAISISYDDLLKKDAQPFASAALYLQGKKDIVKYLNAEGIRQVAVGGFIGRNP